MAIDRTGISTGEEVRRLVEQIENELLLNYRNFFIENRDTPLSHLDINAWKKTKFELLGEFERLNKQIIGRYSSHIKKAILSDFRESYDFGIGLIERYLKRAQKRGFKPVKGRKALAYTRNPKVKAKVKEINQLLNSAYNNALRHMRTQYIRTVRTIDQVGGRTLMEAIERASRGLGESGVVANITANNRQIKMSNYIELNSVEFSQEMLFLGEGAKAEEAEIYTVYISKHTSPCPLCRPWEGKILIDDVYRGGKPDGKHELLSTAIKAGLSHPNCRHHFLPYVEGLDVIPESEKKRKPRDPKLYEAEQELRYVERQIRDWKTREAVAMTPQRAEYCRAKVRQWQARARQLVKSHDGLYRNYWREKPGFKVPKDIRWGDLKYSKKIFD